MAALREQARAAMLQAARFYRGRVASHGGYVYYYSPDLKRRWGEGEATKDQIWVQPPGTPRVGMAYLKAYEATGDEFYLDAATETAEALIYGQLQSGGWTNCIDFNPRGNRVSLYRNGKGRGRNFSSLDDDQSQSAIRFLMRADRAHHFKHRKIREAVSVALDALLKAQFNNGAFPQGWDETLAGDQPVLQAGYPDYDWRTEGRIKNYWDMYTLNDGLAGDVADTLIDAHRIYHDDRYRAALARLGDFLILAQMPDPQPAWAQQYNYQMHPIWARRFEPAAIAGRESQDVLETLLKIYRHTGEEKYLEPVPRAVKYLRNSLLPDGRLARYYELKTNRPLYMSRRGRNYTLTYDDSDLPRHYGWKVASRLDEIDREYRELKTRGRPQPAGRSKPDIRVPRPSPNGAGDLRSGPRRGRETRAERALERQVRRIIDELDEQGRWISTYRGEPLVGQPDFQPGQRYISSEVFSRHLETLADYVAATR